PCSTASSPEASPGSPRARPTRRSASPTTTTGTRRRSPRPSPRCGRRASTVPTRSPSGPAATPGSSRRPSTAATPRPSTSGPGPVVWAPAVDGAVVLSQRGGDFALTIGEDLALGYAGHTASTVDLYVEETLAFRVLTPEAAVPLAHLDG